MTIERMTLTNCYALQFVADAVTAMRSAREVLVRMVDDEAERARRAGAPIAAEDLAARKALLLRYLEQLARACELEAGLSVVDAGAFDGDEWRSAMGADLAPQERSALVASSTTREAATPRDAARILMMGPTPIPDLNATN